MRRTDSVLWRVLGFCHNQFSHISVAKNATSQKRAKLFYPESSKTIFKSINEALEFVYPGATQKNKEPYFKALVVICLPGSSLERDIEKFERLTRLEVHLTKKVKSRTFSQWTNNWQ